MVDYSTFTFFYTTQSITYTASVLCTGIATTINRRHNANQSTSHGRHTCLITTRSSFTTRSGDRDGIAQSSVVSTFGSKRHRQTIPVYNISHPVCFQDKKFSKYIKIFAFHSPFTSVFCCSYPHFNTTKWE